MVRMPGFGLANVGPVVEAFAALDKLPTIPPVTFHATDAKVKAAGRLAEDRFFVFGSGPAEEYHMRWFEAHLPERGVALRSLRPEMVGLSIAGPRARDLLQRLTHRDVSTKSFPFLSFREMELGMIPAKVGRMTFTGDLGYELWVTADYQLALYDLLLREGTELGLGHFGGRAQNALRLEKSWGTWAREFRPIYGPFEAGLDRFVDLSKADFIGRDAALKEKESGGKLRLHELP